MRVPPPCRSVRLACHPESVPPMLPVGVVVRVGSHVMGCRVAFCAPRVCRITAETSVRVEQAVEMRVEPLKRNVLVELRLPRGGREYYVYPKSVWEELERRFIKPLSAGDPPSEPGALLYGPPGTGKSSAAEILGETMGLSVVRVDPSSVLSKWLGESEKKLHQLLSQAESSEPAEVIIDDAEWLIRSRESLAAGGDRTDSGAYLGMMQILLQTLQRWKRERRHAVMITTTNVGPDKIDPALLRSQRLGRPIFFPLPDFEAVYTYMTVMGVDPREAEKWAARAVNAGLNMADVAGIVEDLRAGREPKIEPMSGRGYVRVAPRAPSRATLEKLAEYARATCFCEALEGPARLWLGMPYTVAIPLVCAVACYVCKRPVVVAHDPRYLDEAIATAEVSGSVLVLNTELLPKDLIIFAATVAKCPLLFCGTIAPPTAHIPISRPLESIDWRAALAEVVSEYYGLKLTKHDLDELLRLRSDTFMSVLRAAGIAGAKSYRALRKMMAPLP